MIRVRDTSTGHEYTVASLRAGMVQIDKPATDDAGNILPPVHNLSPVVAGDSTSTEETV